MALVAYGSSDESDIEEEDNDQTAGSVELCNGNKSKEIPQDEAKNSSEGDQLFVNLPQPKKLNDTIEEVQDEYLNKKEVPLEKPKPKTKIKIGVPSLEQYESDDDEDSQAPQRKPAAKASGLFAVLPPPKGTALSNKSFIPNVLARKPPAPKPQKKVIPKPKPQTTKEPSEASSGSEDEKIEIFDGETWEKVCAPKKRAPKRPLEVTEETASSANISFIEIAPEPEKPYDGLDNAAFKELVGSTKRRKENIKLIDINEDEVLPEKDQWLLKSITDPSVQPQNVVDDPVNDTCKRKHHITYLAQQAKANEQELQNQWSQNKYNRRLTQSKYGF